MHSNFKKLILVLKLFLLLVYIIGPVAVNFTYANGLYLAQLDKSEMSGLVIKRDGWTEQKIACEDLQGFIDQISVQISTSQHSIGYIQYEMRVRGFSGDSFSQVSDTIVGNEGMTQDYTFRFSPSIDVQNTPNLCTNFQELLIGLRTNGMSYVTGKVWGSLSDTAYRDIEYRAYNAGSLRDLYFIINGNAEVNQPPVLNEVGDKAIAEGSLLSFTVSSTDPDGDSLTYSAANLPSGATFDAQTQTFNWTSDYDSAGIYEVVFSVTDGELSNTATATIEVLNTNRAPVLEPIGNQSTAENQNLSFTISATDPDGDSLTYSATNLPSGATFDPQTQTFSWIPGYNDAGNYIDIEFTVIDSGSPMELDIELITVTVGNVNRAPVINNPGPQEVLETDTLSFSVSAIDPDGDAVTYSASNTPAGSAFNPETGVFSWTPGLSDEGVYMVTFIASDDGSPQESAELTIVITVGDNPTPTEQAEDLVQDIVVFAFPTNIENSYLANLHKVAQFILDGKINAALNQLDAFVNKLTQDYNQGVITQQEYNSLLSAANNLIADLQN